jgi:6-pyruvoyltetrahydropterin/6-carboxytetrahydropterin synthase
MLRFMIPLNDALGGRLDICRLRLSPYYSWELSMSASTGDPASRKAMLRQRFDFAASHRLHVASLSPEENTRLFGKCNLPNGHGHNYMIEPAVEVALSPAGEPALSLQTLEAIVDREIIERYDHKHLNLDTPEFGEQGVNPSVENIARVFFDRLEPRIREASPGARLAHVTVWETDRTSSTYPA